MKKPSVIVLALAAVAACCGCSSSLSREFRILESRVDENPDSVLAAIDSTTAVRKLDRSSSARLALVRSMAIDKSFGTVTADDIRPAADYFRMPWQRKEKMLTLFYQGCACYNDEDYPQATVYYTKAQNMAESLGDDMFAGLALLSKSSAFSKDYNYEAELESALLGHEFIRHTGNQRKINSSKLTVGDAYCNSEMYDRAEEFYLSGLSWFKEKRDSFYIPQFLLSYAKFQMIKPDKDPACAIKLYTEALNEYEAGLTPDDYGVLAYAYAKKGDVQTADAIINGIKSSDGPYPEHMSYWEYCIARQKSDSGRALELLEQSVNYQDSILSQRLKESSLKSLNAFHEQEAVRTRQSNLTITLVSISLILSLICVIVLLRMLKNRKIQKLETEKEAILSVTENERDEFSRLKKKLFYSGTSEFSILRKLCDDYVMLQDDRSREQFAKERIVPLLNSVRNERGENNELEKLINLEMDGLMAKIRADMKNFTNDDFRLVCYVIAGFDASLIARLMDKSKGDVYSRKHRLIQRILSSNTENKELYTAVFSK